MQIQSALKRLTRFQKTVLILLVLVVLDVLLGYTTGYSLPRSGLIRVAFVVSLVFLLLTRFRPLTRKLVWRVRNRLLVTFVLFGVVPIFLILIMLSIGFVVVFGQVSANLVHDAINGRVDSVYEAARDREPIARVGLFRTTNPVPAEAPFREIPRWMTPGFKGIITAGGRVYIAALAREPRTTESASTFTWLPLDSETLDEIPVDLGSITVAAPDVQIERQVTIADQTQSRPATIPTFSTSRALPAGKGFWDLRIGWPTLLPIRNLDGKEANIVVTVTSRPSLVIPRLFRSLGVFAYVLGVVLIILGSGFLVVEVISLILTLRLTRSITGAVHDLYVGTQHVANEDFSHRIPVRSRDQLSELAGSFNGMTEHIQHLIVEVKEKEKLEAELEIAREVQAQLFPRGVPILKTLELAGVCNPARVVSGGYYDFVPFAAQWTAIVIGDIAGKGISAALLMASVQSSLHAQLTAMDTTEAPSTAVLVARLNRQLYDSTAPAKYATFYCAVYDDISGVLAYTNAGHLPPLLVRNGVATRLEGNGMVVGVVPDTPYEQVMIQLQTGDLVAAFTDGITESENEQSEEFGESRLAALLVEHATKPLDELVGIVTKAVREWAFDLDNQDDTTMLLARRL